MEEYFGGHQVEIKRNELVKKEQAQKEQEENQSKIRDAQIERNMEIKNEKHIRSLELSMLREKEQKLKEQKEQFKMKDKMEKEERNKEISNNVRFNLGTRRSFKPLSCNPYQKAEKKQMVTPQEWVKQRDFVKYVAIVFGLNKSPHTTISCWSNESNEFNESYESNVSNEFNESNESYEFNESIKFEPMVPLSTNVS
ncbi:hypothetical protein ACTFIR_003633 [Dictyostelium discoideum]